MGDSLLAIFSEGEKEWGLLQPGCGMQVPYILGNTYVTYAQVFHFSGALLDYFGLPGKHPSCGKRSGKVIRMIGRGSNAEPAESGDHLSVIVPIPMHCQAIRDC